MSDLRGEVAIVGVGTTEFARVLPGKTTWDLQIEAAMAAIEDAGLEKGEIDGIITAEGVRAVHENPRAHIAFSEHLGNFNKTMCMSMQAGGGDSGVSVEVARWAIGTGRCKNVLVVGGRAQTAEVAARGRHESLGFGEEMGLEPFHSANYELPYGPLVPTFFAAVAQRHMHEYGTTPEQLAAVAVAARKHARLNPAAVHRDPISVSDVLASPLVSSPLHELDLGFTSDGGAALVLTSAARATDSPSPPVYLLGVGQHTDFNFSGMLAAGNPELGLSLTSSAVRLAAQDAFSEAGLAAEDVGFAELYDNCTISPIIQLEDIGFCERGEGGAFVENGHIELGGDLPLNTHGGHLACNFTPAGYNNWVEAVRQLRGEAGDRQVPGAEVGLVSTYASIMSAYVSVGILSRST